MKAISLLQPWATLVAIGAKRIETRSWRTDYRGPLAIHASKGLGGRKDDYLDLVLSEPFRSALCGVHIPFGKVVAVCELVSVRRIGVAEKLAGWEWRGPDGVEYRFGLTDRERAFGDYADGRYAWLLYNIRPLDVPVSAKGSLGLWEWSG